jgi:phosphohistidine phosphatase
MHLLVIRHAIAEARAPHEDDAGRRLTFAGERRFKGVVNGLRRLGWRLDRVLTSPWARATRTAELLRPLGAKPPVTTDLLVQSPRADLLSLINESLALAKKRRAVAVVGHEPWLGELVAWLAFGDSRHHHALVLKKGGVVWLDGTATPGGMMLRAQLPPRVLRAI